MQDNENDVKDLSDWEVIQMQWNGFAGNARVSYDMKMNKKLYQQLLRTTLSLYSTEIPHKTFSKSWDIPPQDW